MYKEYTQTVRLIEEDISQREASLTQLRGAGLTLLHQLLKTYEEY